MGIKDKLGKVLSKLKRAKPVLEEEKGDDIKSVSLSDEAWETLFDLYQDLGARPAGSEASEAAAKAIKREFDRQVPDAKLSKFRVVPRLWLCLSTTAVIVSIAMSAFTAFGLPYVGIVLAAGFVFLAVLELSCGNGILRRIYPSAKGTNLHAVIDPVGEVKRTVVFTAHHDSAPVELKETTNELLLKNYYLSFVSLVVSAVYSFAALCVELARGYVVMPNMPCIGDIVMIGVSILFLIPQFRVIWNRKRAPFTGGAGDDLSGVSVVIELLRYFRKEPMNGTRLVFASFDGNECGAQGAAAWYAENKSLLINPVSLNFEGLYDAEDLVFLVMDGNGMVPLSETFAAKCIRVGDAMGYHIPTDRLGFMGGMTDAAAAAVAAVDAVTLTSMKPGVKTAAHTEGDLPVTVSKEALARAMEIAIKYVQSVDTVKTKNQPVAPEMEVPLLESDRKYKLSKF